MKTVFICSPYRTNKHYTVEQNIAYARQITTIISRMGYAPITPHLYITQCLSDDIKTDRKLGCDICKALLKKCDYIFIATTLGVSKGMKAEIKFAKKNKIKRFNSFDIFINKQGFLECKLTRH